MILCKPFLNLVGIGAGQENDRNVGLAEVDFASRMGVRGRFRQRFNERGKLHQIGPLPAGDSGGPCYAFSLRILQSAALLLAIEPLSSARLPDGADHVKPALVHGIERAAPLAAFRVRRTSIEPCHPHLTNVLVALHARQRQLDIG